MHNLELNAHFYRELIRPILATHFGDLPHAAARIGHGSEVLGYDDTMSTDHDWGLRLQLFLHRDDYTQHAEEIVQTLAEQLPYTFRGYSTHFSPPDPNDNGSQTLSVIDSGPVNHRITVHTVRSFVHQHLAFDIEQPLTPADWLTFTQQRLLGLTKGAVYHDTVGLEKVRHQFAYFPDDIWLYLLAAGWTRINQEDHLMGRAGFAGDEIGSALIGARLVRDIMSLCFLMARRYAPYPKWFGKAFGELDCAMVLEPILRGALSAENWQTREQHLVAAYQHLAQMHNDLQITAPVSTQTIQFFSRPFRVITHNGMVAALVDQIKDEAIRKLAQKPLIGSIDQFSDNTDLRSDLRWRPMLRQLY